MYNICLQIVVKRKYEVAENRKVLRNDTEFHLVSVHREKMAERFDLVPSSCDALL